MKILANNNLYNNKTNTTSSIQAFKGRSKQFDTMIDKFVTKKSLSVKEQRSVLSILTKAIDKIIVESKNLGSGAYNTVYSIASKNSKYVLRVPHKVDVKTEIKKGEVVLGNNQYHSLKSYFGEPVMKIGKLQILKNMGDATVLGVPDKVAKSMNKQEIEEYFLNNYLPMLSTVPQESFNAFTHDVNRLNLRVTGDGFYCKYDSINPNNTALTKDKKFVFVDEFLKSKYPDPNNATSILEALILNATKEVYAPFSEEKANLYRQVLSKIVKSAQVENMHFTSRRDDYFLWNEALRLSKVNKKGMSFLADLGQIRSKYPKESWVEMTDKYLSELFEANKL